MREKCNALEQLCQAPNVIHGFKFLSTTSSSSAEALQYEILIHTPKVLSSGYSWETDGKRNWLLVGKMNLKAIAFLFFLNHLKGTPEYKSHSWPSYAKKSHTFTLKNTVVEIIRM